MPGFARPLVSAIVTTRNRPNLLREALESVLHQEGAGQEYDQETIVVDDVSTEATAQVVAAYPTVRYIRQPERRGLSAARNVGAAQSRGQYIAFLDDDDLWLPGKLRLQVPALEAHPEAGAVYSHIVVRSGGHEWVKPADPHPLSGAIFEGLLTATAGRGVGGVLRFLIRRTALDVAGPFDETLTGSEDYDLWLRLAFHFPILFVPGRVGVYRPSPGGLAATIPVNPDQVRYIVEKALALLPDEPSHAPLKKRARAWAEAMIVTRLADARDADAILPQMMEAVRRHPTMLREPGVRDGLASTVRRCVRAFDSPFSIAQAASADLYAAASDAGPRHDLGRTVAAIWADAAVDLLRRSPRRWNEVCSAMARTLMHDPAYVIQRLFRAIRIRMRNQFSQL